MKKKNTLALALLLLISCLLPCPALANAGEPPSLTVLVSRPPDDLSMTLQLPDGSAQEALKLVKGTKAWEAYYRFFNTHLSGTSVDQDAVLTVSYWGKNLQFPLTADDFSYNSLVTLDLNAGTLTWGQPAWRIPLLVAMRVVSTLLIEGLVFFLFQYRQKRSWIVFLAVNLITQMLLNMSFTGPQYYGYWIIAYVLGEVLVLAAEMIAYTLLLREFSKGRGLVCALSANAASLILGGLMITYLPI